MAKKQKKRPVTTENPWFAIFRKQDAAYVLRMQEGILSDVERMISYFVAIRIILRVPNYEHTYPCAETSAQQLARKFRALPIEEISQLLKKINQHEIKSPSQVICEYFLLRSLPEDTSERSLQLMNTLLDVSDIQEVDGKDYYAIKKPIIIWIDLVRRGWFRALTRMMETQDAVPLLRVFELLERSDSDKERKLEIIHSEEMEQLPVAHEEGYNIPCPPDAYEWVESHLRAHQAREAERDRQIFTCAEHVKKHASWYEDQYESMWLDLMLHPKWALRRGNLDCAGIHIPELRAAGIQAIHLDPLPNFPDFVATFIVRYRCIKKESFKLILTPSHLRDEKIRLGDETEDDLDETRVNDIWASRFIVFVALYAAWKIIMGELACEGTIDGKGNGIGSSAIVRARLRRLPEGQRASEKARRRAKDAIGITPPPAFTFVREYQRGNNHPQYSEPLFSITDSDFRRE